MTAPGDIADLVASSRLDATGARGTPASDAEYRFDVERTVAMLGDALARLHSTPLPASIPSATPLHGPSQLVQEARDAVESGRVTRDTLSREYRHMSPERLLEVLIDGQPTEPVQPVLTHGRPDLHHLIGWQGELVGLVGWHHAGLGDRYRDLAAAARSVATDLGPMLVAGLFDQYQRSATGSDEEVAAPDARRLDWYALAIELAR